MRSNSKHEITERLMKKTLNHKELCHNFLSLNIKLTILIWGSNNYEVCHAQYNDNIRNWNAAEINLTLTYVYHYVQNL